MKSRPVDDPFVSIWYVEEGIVFKAAVLFYRSM